MKYLIKSSFKSFFQYKFAIILLSIIVFITSAAFTMFQSTSNAFDRSYNNVVTQGVLHDFTIKEKYPEAGDIYLDSPKLGSQETIAKDIQDTSSANVLVGKDGHIYIATNIIDRSISTTAYVEVDNISPTATSIPAKIVSQYYTSGSWLGFSDGFVKYDPAPQSNKNEIIKMFDDPQYKGKIGSKNTLAVQDITLTPTTKSFKLSNDGNSRTMPFTFSSFLSTLNGRRQATLKHVTGDYNHYSFQLTSSSDQIAKNAFSELSPTDWASVSGLSGNDFIVSKSFEGDTDEMDHVTNLNFVPFNYKLAAENLKNLLADKIAAGKSKIMKDSILKPYVDKGEISYKDVESLYVTSDKNAYRFVNEKEQNPSVDKLRLFSGFGLPKQEDPVEMKARLRAIDGEINDSNTVDKGYSMVASWQHHGSILWKKFTVPKSASVLDTSSFAAVVSPSYAASKGLKALSKNEYDDITKKLKIVLDKSNHTFQDLEAILSQYSKNVIWAQATPYLVTGIGITPDFSYPIVDSSNPIPDSSNQAIVYTNGNGYNRIQDAFRGNSTENYIAVKVTKGDKEKIMEEINEKLKLVMNWPAGIQPARLTNDTNEKVILAPQRITFLQTIKKTVSTISWVTILLMILFTAFIVGLVVKKKIASRTKQLAILMANGYTKLQIALSMMVIGLIVAGVSTILGYAIGHWLQFAFISIFNNYWTLPIWETQFSWLSLVLTVVVPIIGVSLLAFLIALWQLRGNLINKLNGSSSKTKGAFSNGLVRAASFVGIKTKVSVSIFASNISKMVMALVAFAMTIIVGSLTFNTFGKFDYALKQSENKIKYDFQVDLASPTREAGKYSLMNLDNLFKDRNGVDIDLNDIYIPIDGQKNDKGLTVKDMFYTTTDGKHLNNIFPHVPTMTDQDGEKNDGLYLKNRIQFKALLNPWLGSAGVGASGWEIAKDMMPENQKNQADKRFVDFLNYTQKTAEESGKKYSFMDPSNKWYATLKQNKTLMPKDVEAKSITSGKYSFTNPDIEMNDSYLDFVAYGVINSIKEYDSGNRDVPIPFFLTYGNVLADNDDEVYTYIKSTNVYKNFSGHITKEALTVRGISASSENIILNNEAKKALFEAEKDYTNNQTVDIVINKYFAKTHKLSIGDEFTSTIDNHADLTMGKVGSKFIPNVNYKVVSIQNSFDEGRVFTSQKIADEILGWGANSDMFNGIYSKHSDELLFKNLPLYSPSGAYPATDTLSSAVVNPADAALESWIKTPVANGGIKNTNIKTYADYLQHYGKSPMVMSYSSVDWATATDFKFHSVLKLSSSLLWMIQSITLFIALLFVALISSMIISDNKKFISTLKVLGYRSSEISRMFVTTFLPSLLFAIALTIPIAFGILAGIQAVMIGFGHVLIPLQISGWEIVAATAVLVIGFSTVYWASSRELKTTSVLKAFE